MHEGSPSGPRFSTDEQTRNSIRLTDFSTAIERKENPWLQTSEMLVFKFPDEKTCLKVKVEQADAPAEKEDGDEDLELQLHPKSKKDLFQLVVCSELDGTWKIAPNSAELKIVAEIPSLATLEKLTHHLQSLVDQKEQKSVAATDPITDGRRLKKMAMMLARIVVLHHKEQSATFCADEALVAQLTTNKRVLKTFGHLLTDGIAKNFKTFVLLTCGYSAYVSNLQDEPDHVVLPLSYALLGLGAALIPVLWTVQNQFNYAARTQETPIWDRRLGRFQWDYRAICIDQSNKYGGCYFPNAIMANDQQIKPNQDNTPAYKQDVIQKYRGLSRRIVAATVYSEVIDAMAMLLLMTQSDTESHSKSSFALYSALGALIGFLKANTNLRVQTSVAWDCYAVEQHRKTGEIIPPLSALNSWINWRSRDGLKILRVFLPILTIATEVYPALTSSLFKRLFNVSPRGFAGGLGSFFAIGAAAKVTLYDMRKVGQPLGEKIVSHPFPDKNCGGKLANGFAQLVGADFMWRLWELFSCEDKSHSDRARYKSSVDLPTSTGLPTFLEWCYALGLFFSKQHNLQVVLDHAVLPYLSTSCKDRLTNPIVWVITPLDILTTAFAAWGCHQQRKQAHTAFDQEQERRKNYLMHSTESEDVSDFAKVQLDCQGQSRDNQDEPYTVSYLALS